MLSCVPPAMNCEDPGYDMAVLGDRVNVCQLMGNGTAIRLELGSSNNASGRILVFFDGFVGAGTYLLDDPQTRFVSVDDNVPFAGCGGVIDIGKRVTAPDPNCGSPACAVEVEDPEPALAYPKTLTFIVHCSSLCENGSDVTCAGPIDFAIRAECSG